MRKQGWEVILQQYIDTQRDMPFAWGVNDCVLFSANAANAILEEDLQPQIDSYGDYDEDMGKALILECNGIAGIFDRHFKRKPIKTANRGDIVLVKYEGNKVAGICNGRNVICKTHTGIKFIPIDLALAAWSVE